MSEAGEVRPLSAHGIVALSCRYADSDDAWVAAYSPSGVRFANGETRPTYDVVLLTRPEQDRVQQQPVRAVQERPERRIVRE